jgi:hypothetical protein
MRLVDAATALVVTGNVALVAPAGTVTLAGTVATAGLLLDRLTAVPPDGAADESVAAPVEGDPPTSVFGFRVIDASELGGAMTVITAVRVALNTPVIVTEVSTATGEVVMLKLAKPSPAGIVTVAGTCAAAVLLLESVTTAPPAGAALFMKRVALIGFPPVVPLTLGVTSRSISGAFGSAVTWKNAVRLSPPALPVTDADAAESTGLVVTLKLAVLFPAATVALAGTWAIAGSLLERATTVPPGGAGTESPTVPRTVPPPITAFGRTSIANIFDGPGPPGSTRSVLACSIPVSPYDP